MALQKRMPYNAIQLVSFFSLISRIRGMCLVSSLVKRMPAVFHYDLLESVRSPMYHVQNATGRSLAATLFLDDTRQTPGKTLHVFFPASQRGEGRAKPQR